jgi:hypothetical protein
MEEDRSENAELLALQKIDEAATQLQQQVCAFPSRCLFGFAFEQTGRSLFHFSLPLG